MDFDMFLIPEGIAKVQFPDELGARSPWILRIPYIWHFHLNARVFLRLVKKRPSEFRIRPQLCLRLPLQCRLENLAIRRETDLDFVQRYLSFMPVCN